MGGFAGDITAGASVQTRPRSLKEGPWTLNVRFSVCGITCNHSYADKKQHYIFKEINKCDLYDYKNSLRKNSERD